MLMTFFGNNLFFAPKSAPIPVNSPHSLEVEERESEDPNADPRDAPHLGQVPPHLEVLPHHDAAGVPHGGAAHGQQNAVAGGGGKGS